MGLYAENGVPLLVGIWWQENKSILVEWKVDVLFHETAIIVVYWSSPENFQFCAVYLEKKKEPLGEKRAPYVKRNEEGT